MDTSPSDPDAAQTDAIVDALARIRGRRGGPRGAGFPWGPGFPGGPGGMWGPGGPGGPGGPWDPRGGDRDGHGRDWPGAGTPGHGEQPSDEHGHGGRGRGGRGGRERFGGPAQLRLLGTLAQSAEPLTVSELAERIGVDQPRASRLVQQSIERGFALREADPRDARRTLVRLTDAGLHAVRGFHGRQREDMSAALTALAPEERAELARLLTKLAAAWPEH